MLLGRASYLANVWPDNRFVIMAAWEGELQRERKLGVCEGGLLQRQLLNEQHQRAHDVVAQ